MTPSALTAARFLFALGVAFAALAWYLRRPRYVTARIGWDETEPWFA